MNSSTWQINNWKRFAENHHGDWYGTWFRYSPSAEVDEVFRCIRSFHLSEDMQVINHQNHYIYSDGREETKHFGPYPQPNVRSLFLDNSFSWGSNEVKAGEKFFFETGFRYQTKRTSLGTVYSDDGNLEKTVAIAENLDDFAEISNFSPPEAISRQWKGTLTKMTPDFKVSSVTKSTWKPLSDLNNNYLTLHLTNGISLHCPPQIMPNKEFVLAMDWLINPNLLHRGIRHFDRNGFTAFTLEVFDI